MNRVKNPGEAVAQIFAKIPGGINALRTVLPLGSSILVFIAFLLTGLLKISRGRGVLYHNPTPLTPLCVSMFDLNSFKFKFSILTLTVKVKFKIFKGEISRSTVTTFNKQTEGQTDKHFANSSLSISKFILFPKTLFGKK